MSDFPSNDLLRHARAEVTLMPRGSREDMEAIARVFPFVVSWQRPAGPDDYDWGYTLCGSKDEAESCACLASMNNGGATVHETSVAEYEDRDGWLVRGSLLSLSSFIDGEPDERCWFDYFRGEFQECWF